MNTRILNREGKLPADGYYHIEAKGEHINHRSKVVLVIDDKAVTSIANRFAQEAETAGTSFAGQRIDKDHLSQSEENPTEAMGWNKAILNRAEGIFAAVKWTPLGRPLVKPDNPDDEPAYKFFSTEYLPEECERLGTRMVNNRRYDVMRPLRLDGLSLTNDPNNKGQRPISNRNGRDAGAGNNQPDPTMKEINKSLGLAEDAPEASTVAEIQKIRNRATSAETERDALKTERDALLADVVERDLEKFKGVIKNRDTWKKQLIANRKGSIELLEALQEAAAPGADKKITSRSSATPPAGGASATEGDAAKEEARAAKISNRARAIRAADKSVSIAKSYEQAEAEVAETDAK